MPFSHSKLKLDIKIFKFVQQYELISENTLPNELEILNSSTTIGKTLWLDLHHLIVKSDSAIFKL